MRTPISGIVTGFRIKKGTGKDASDYGLLDIVQCGDKTHDTSLIFVYVQEIEHIQYLLENYSNGSLKWIDIYAVQILNGRELIWMLEDIYEISDQNILIEGV